MDRSKIESVIEGLFNYCNYEKICISKTTIKIGDLSIYLENLNSAGISGHMIEAGTLINFKCSNYDWYWYTKENES